MLTQKRSTQNNIITINIHNVKIANFFNRLVLELDGSTIINHGVRCSAGFTLKEKGEIKRMVLIENI